jgi:uncharacterized membrane protein YdbT with pleckstrin-like domain
MGTYADSLLTQGEVVLRRERKHWLSLFLETRLSILLWIIAIVVLVVVFVRRTSDTINDGLSIGALVIIALGLAFFAFRWWHWKTDEYIITNRRLLKVDGIINKHSADSNLEKINDAILDENFLGRILDYGDLDILTAAEVAVDKYRMLNHAKSFKKQMLTAKHALEDGHSYSDISSPPLQAVGAPPASGPADPHLTQRADTPDEVTEALVQLATLRDSGAITAADYETKKQELLGRL